MSFGIQVIGKDASGTFTVTDTDKNLLGYSIVAAGAGSSVQLSGSTKQPLIFVNAKGVTAADTDGIVTLWNASNNTYYFYSPVVYNYTTSPFDADLLLTPRAVNFFAVRSMDEISPDTTQTHGIQLSTSSGDIMVDSRSFPVNGSFYISQIVAAGNAVAGGTITQDEDAYIEMNILTFSDTQPVSGQTSGGYFYRSAKFKSTHIEFYGQAGVYLAQVFGGSWWSEFTLDNYSPILVGKLR